jgi:hypothetical protein
MPDDRTPERPPMLRVTELWEKKSGKGEDQEAYVPRAARPLTLRRSKPSSERKTCRPRSVTRRPRPFRDALREKGPCA